MLKCLCVLRLYTSSPLDKLEKFNYTSTVRQTGGRSPIVKVGVRKVRAS